MSNFSINYKSTSCPYMVQNYLLPFMNKDALTIHLNIEALCYVTRVIEAMQFKKKKTNLRSAQKSRPVSAI